MVSARKVNQVFGGSVMLTAHKAREKMMADCGILMVIKRAIDMSCRMGNTKVVICDADKYLNIAGAQEEYAGQHLDRRIAVSQYLLDLGYEVNFKYNHSDRSNMLTIEWQSSRPMRV